MLCFTFRTAEVNCGKCHKNMCLNSDYDKKTTICEDICEKCLDDRTRKTVNSHRSYSVLCFYEHKRKAAPKPRSFYDRRSVGLGDSYTQNCVFRSYNKLKTKKV